VLKAEAVPDTRAESQEHLGQEADSHELELTGQQVLLAGAEIPMMPL